MFLLWFAAASGFAAERWGRYALILTDPAGAAGASSLESIQSASALSYREQIRKKQEILENELVRRKFHVTGAVQTVLDAIFVEAPASRLAELAALPGVKGVAPLHRFRRTLDRAVQLEDVPAAWAALGGTEHAGAGVKIAIIDTGIDQNHPAMQDASLTPPAGFPKCSGQDCAFTNNKVIVARSYVSILASGSLSGGPANSRPDDTSPRDHVGHGTALASIAAGNTNAGPIATITGLAPQAWVGNYKVFGSPGLNDYTGGDVLISAIDDAVTDGMDIAVLSLGSPALTGPLDTGAICGAPAGTPCDPEAQAVENAVHAGMLIAASAGNDGASGTDQNPALNTIESPATAPSALAAGASTNSHTFINAVRVLGSDVPSGLSTVPAVFGDGPLPAAPVTAPVADTQPLDGTGFGCNAFAPNALSGDIAIILRTRGGAENGCNFLAKATNAEDAGAVGVIFVQDQNSEDLTIGPGGLAGTNIPAVLIGPSEGAALKSWVASHPDTKAATDPNLVPVDVTGNMLAYFSSQGPSITYLLKPEMVGVGTDVYMATQKLDPNGEMYDPSGYTIASGTSFSAPMAAGAAALVKQKNPGFTPFQLKSAVVNTATQDITDTTGTAGPLAVGNGKVDAGRTVSVTVTSDPATVSFGAIGQTANLPTSRTLTIHYAGSSTATLSLSMTGINPPSLDKTSLAFAPNGADQTVTLTLSGSTPSPGIYPGALTIQGAGTPVRIPCIYIVPDGIPADIVPITGDAFDATAGQDVPGGLAFKVVDQYGAAVQNLAVQWAGGGGAAIGASDPQTDIHGVATADGLLGSDPGQYEFAASAGNLNTTFSGIARAIPTINPGGAVNAASFQQGNGIVPGYYISLFGSDMSDTVQGATFVPLPLAISPTSVSFEVPSAGISLPGYMLYADPSQVNVQVPWELAGQTGVQIRVNVSQTSGQVFSASVTNYSPAIYVTADQTAAALDENSQPVTSSNAATRGHAVQLFANGLDPVDNPPPDGSVAPSTPLVHTESTVSVTVGGKTAQVQFSGLAPGFPALNQVNCVVPPDAPTGLQPVVVSVSGQFSPPVNMPVQ